MIIILLIIYYFYISIFEAVDSIFCFINQKWVRYQKYLLEKPFSLTIINNILNMVLLNVQIFLLEMYAIYLLLLSDDACLTYLKKTCNKKRSILNREVQAKNYGPMSVVTINMFFNFLFWISLICLNLSFSPLEYWWLLNLQVMANIMTYSTVNFNTKYNY